MPTPNFLLRQKEVLRLKRTPNADGKPMTVEEIGKVLGLSRSATMYYLSPKVRQGRCPYCCQLLDKPKATT
jgi:hypothetical protein